VGACATAAVSLEEGVDKIRLGKAELVVTGGYDDLTEEAIIGFGDMAATADTKMMRDKGISDARFSRANDRRRLGFLEAQGGGTILLARGDLAIDADIVSDTAPLHELVEILLAAAPSTRWMRDATRGGVGTVCNELAKDSPFAVILDEDRIPIEPQVAGACDLLGIDPLYVANEGKFVAIVPADEADAAVTALHAHPQGARATVVGEIVAEPPGIVALRTAFGGSRIVDMLVGDPLPRIC
nr:AIR synthase-related protein [Streptomyces sp. DSM 41633]